MTDKSRLQHRYDRIRKNAKRYSERMTDEDRKLYREMVPPPEPSLTGASPVSQDVDKSRE